MPAPPPNATPNMFCRHCGYALVGLPGNRCPECGHDFDPANPRTFLARPRRVVLRRIVRIVLVLFCLTLPTASYFAYLDWQVHQEADAIQILRANDRYTCVYYYDTTPRWAKVILRGRAAWLWKRVEHVDSTSPTSRSTNPAQSLAALARLRCIRELSPGRISTGVADSDLAQFKGFTALQQLDLTLCTHVTDAGLAQLGRLPALRTLYLYSTQVTDAGMTQLKNFPALQALSLDRTRVTDAGLVHLKNLTALQTLTLRETHVTDAGLPQIKGLTTLQFLCLDNTQVTDAGLAQLKGLTALKELSLDCTQVTDSGLLELKNFTALEYLCLDYTQVTDTGLATLKAFPALHLLALNGTRITNLGLAQLEGFPALDDLRLNSTKVTHAGVEAFQKAKPNCRIDYYGIRY